MRQQHDSGGRAIHHGEHDQQTHGNRGGGAGERGGREHHGGKDLPWKGGMTAHTPNGTYQITKKGDTYSVRYRGQEVASGMRSIEEAKAEAGALASAENIPTYTRKSQPSESDRTTRYENKVRIAEPNAKGVDRKEMRDVIPTAKKKEPFTPYKHKKEGFKQTIKDFYHSIPGAIEDMFK